MTSEDGEIRVFVLYRELFLADLRALLRDTERAYNQLTGAAEGTPRIRLWQRLRVAAVTTERSIEFVIVGTMIGVLAFAEVIRRLSQARNEFWKSEKTYYEVQKLKREFEERERKKHKLTPQERREYAGAILVERFGRVLDSKYISGVQITAGDSTIVISHDPAQKRLSGSPED